MKGTMNKSLKLILFSCLTILFVSLKSHSVFAQEVKVTLPTFDVTMNEVKIENTYRKYPFIVYKGITYFPMTWGDSRFFGLQTKWDRKTGLEVFYTGELGSLRNYQPDFQSSLNAKQLKASIPSFNVTVNGKVIQNSKEPYPLLLFRNVTYFPLTWRFAVDEFHWDYRFSHKEGLNIKTVKGYGEPSITREKVLAIKIGEMSLEDVEKLIGQELVYVYDVGWYEPWNGSLLVAVNSHSVVWGKIIPHSPNDAKQYLQVTEQNFYKLQSGMSYKEVSAILGGPGTIVFDSLDEKNYVWYGPENTTISLVFQKKSNEFTLNKDENSYYSRSSYWKEISYSPGYPEVTENNFNELELGLSYEQASTVLGGPGSVIYDGPTQRVYVWYGTEENAVTLVFRKDGYGFTLDDAGHIASNQYIDLTE